MAVRHASVAFLVSAVALAAASVETAVVNEDWARVRALGLGADFAQARLAATNQMVVSAPGSDVWQACTTLPVLEKTCLGLYVDESNLTIGVDISVDGHNFSLPLASANQFCMSRRRGVQASDSRKARSADRTVAPL